MIYLNLASQSKEEVMIFQICPETFSDEDDFEDGTVSSTYRKDDDPDDDGSWYMDEDEWDRNKN
jgi:hypothetical protein